MWTTTKTYFPRGFSTNNLYTFCVCACRNYLSHYSHDIQHYTVLYLLILIELIWYGLHWSLDQHKMNVLYQCPKCVTSIMFREGDTPKLMTKPTTVRRSISVSLSLPVSPFSGLQISGDLQANSYFIFTHDTTKC